LFGLRASSKIFEQAALSNKRNANTKGDNKKSDHEHNEEKTCK
jgi:hypothetical protein